MVQWIRFEHAGQTRFGTLERDTITAYEGDMFGAPKPTSETLALSAVKIATPTEPAQLIALWNNFHAMAAKFNLGIPSEPLYFIKAASSYLAGGQVIRRPRSYNGRVVFEGELGIVIGKTTREISENEAEEHILGYTCVNDVTAFGLINKDDSFAQWTRAKSFAGFGVFGPVVATGLDPAGLVVTTSLNGDERQNYPVSDMIFPPPLLVSLISRDITLNAGDVIACGTSLGVGSMKPGSLVEVAIDGIGCLSNRFE